MSRDNSQGIPNVLALVGRNPDLSLQEVFSNGGLVWLLAGAAYPVNIGFCIRTAEVSGASAVIVDAELNNPERSAAKRASMKAHRFIPVHWTPGLDAIKMAKKSGFRIIAVEDVGMSAPWDVDMTGDIILVVGGEKNGISSEILSESDEIVRIPMSGFVPSFNLQAPLSAVAIEAQRQRS
jgi:23S rRNA (guanosine2251-2'-O)-methyltransferase